MEEPRRDISSIILAGGKSIRMGNDKAFVKLRSRAIIEHVLTTLTPLSDDIIIVTNNPERYVHLSQRIVGDLFPDGGSLVGLYSGLRAAHHEYAFVVACDMPFLSAPLIRYMIAQVGDYDAVIPHYDGYYEALHAIYRRDCLPFVAAQLARGDYKIINFFHQIRARYVNNTEIARFDADHWSFFNVNTPEDLARAERRIQL